MKPRNPKIQVYISQFANLYNGKPWYGDPLTRLLENISEEAAFKSLYPGKHTIAQILWHMIYWRLSLIKRLEPDPDFKASMQSPDNWRTNDQLKAMGWSGLKSEFDKSQKALLRLLKKQSDGLLKKEFKKGATFNTLIEGIVQHDLYHTGQIGLLKNLVNQ